MEKHEQVEKKPLHKMLWHNFLGGVAWGLGITVGAAVLLGILGYIASQINYVPIIGSIVTEVILFVEENNPRQ